MLKIKLNVLYPNKTEIVYFVKINRNVVSVVAIVIEIIHIVAKSIIISYFVCTYVIFFGYRD